jgi:hypothetical protein
VGLFLEKEAVELASFRDQHLEPRAFTGIPANYGTLVPESRIELDHARSAIGAAIRKRNAALKTQGSAIHISGGNVGAVQTGHSAVAYVNQTWNSAASEELLKAIVALEEAIGAHTAIAAEERVALVADLREVRAEIQSPTPQQGKIARRLTGVAITLQTLGALPGVYSALKVAARYCNITLP